jgi:hypothetical protein
MNKLEELKAAAEVADTSASDAWDDASADAWDAFLSGHGGALWAARNDAWDAYISELMKIQKENRMSEKALERKIYIVGLVAGAFAIASGVGMMVAIIF